MDVKFLFGWAKENGIELPQNGDGNINIPASFDLYNEWKKKSKKGIKAESSSAESVDIENNQDYNKFAIRDKQSLNVYERIKSGDLYELDELFELPVFKKIEQEIEKYKNTYGKTNEINTTERRQLRKSWVKQFLSGDGADTMPYGGTPLKKEYKATIVVGLPAAGKSTAIANPLSEEQGAFIMDSDEMKKLIPEYKETNGGAADSVHKESKALMKSAFKEFLTGSMKGINIVVPVIGDDAQKLNDNYISQLINSGYNVEIAYKEADTKTSANRVVSRAIKTGRFIPRGIVMGYNDNTVRDAYTTVLDSKHISKSKYSEL